MAFQDLARMTAALLQGWGAAPVIVRELRGESRRMLNYWMRSFSAGIICAALAAALIYNDGGARQLGAALFDTLHTALLLAILLLAPLLTSDAISREKREGTLGLLFLTPLSAADILVGKTITHGARIFNIVLAALPMMALPFLLGGVPLRTAIHSALVIVVALIFALAAGLYASSRQYHWTGSILLAEFYCGVAAALFLDIETGSRAAYAVLLGALAVAAFFFYRSGRLLSVGWQQDFSHFVQPRWVRIFSSSDFWRSFFRWNKSQTLDRNPIAWLQEYSWTGRLTKWGWLAVTLAFETFIVFLIWRRAFFLWEVRLMLLLALAIAFTSAGSFRRERQSGALELLLITPISPARLIFGRLWGVWGAFFPSVAVVLFIWLAVPFENLPPQYGFALLGLWTFLSLPFIGFYFSLLRLNFFSAWVATIGVGLAIPYYAVEILLRGNWRWRYQEYTWKLVWCSLGQLALGALCWYLLHRILVRRAFAINPHLDKTN